MNKSLLRILKVEDNILNSISGCEYHIAILSSDLDRVRHCGPDCLAKQNDIEMLEGIIVREKENMTNYQQELAEVRSEMRDYFMHLFEKGGENNG